MSKTLRVLLVDDASADRYTERRSLERIRGTAYDIYEADTAEDALQRLETVNPDVVIVDQHLPGHPGTWLIGEVRKREDGGPAVVMLTGTDHGQAAESAFHLGSDEYLIKDGLSGPALHQAISNAVLRRRLARRVELLSRRQGRLLDLATSLARALDPRSVLKAVFDHFDDFDARRTTIWSIDEDDLFELVGSTSQPPNEEIPGKGVPPVVPIDDPSPKGIEVAREVARRARVVFAETSERVREELPQLVSAGQGCEAAIFVPFFRQGRVAAVLGIESARELDIDDLQYARVVGGMVSDSLERSSLFEALRRQHDFEQKLLGVVSHDLRNPLNALGLCVQALRDPKALDAVLPRLERSTDRMRRMVEDLLDLTRARFGELVHELVPVDVASTVTETVEGVAGGERIRLDRGPEEALVLGDRSRLIQTFDNLLTNALKYGSTEDPIEVAVRVGPERVVLTFTNWGEPIPEEMKAQIFEPFVTAAEGGTKRESLGLGLYIASAIVKQHGGVLTVSSSREEGTTFTLSLPRCADPEGVTLR